MWKDIPGFNYQINEFAEVRNASGKILKQQKRRYCSVTLSYGKGKQYQCANVGRLVLQAFMGVDDTKQCNHIDGDKHNNHISNLEWATKSENCKHRDATGLRIRAVVKHSDASKLKMRESRLKNSEKYKRNKLGRYEKNMHC